MRHTTHASYYHRMNSLSIFLYVISVVMWWAGFNYAAARASTARRRKLFSTAATLALAWPFAFIALAAALATKTAANIMIAVGDHINNTWDAAVSEETSPALADNTLLMPPPPPPATDEVNGCTTGQGDANDDAAETINKGGDDETITIQKVALSDLL